MQTVGNLLFTTTTHDAQSSSCTSVSLHCHIFSALFRTVDKCLLYVLENLLSCQQILSIHVDARGHDATCEYSVCMFHSTNELLSFFFFFWSHDTNPPAASLS